MKLNKVCEFEDFSRPEIVRAIHEMEPDLKVAYAGEVLAKAVQANQLAGETQGDWDVFISAPSESIANILGGADDAVLFAKPFYYKRLGP